MGLLISFAVLLPVIVFWSIITIEINRKSEKMRNRLLSILLLLLLLVSPLFSEYNNKQNIEYIVGGNHCGNIDLYDSDANRFHLTETKNNDIIELTERDSE